MQEIRFRFAPIHCRARGALLGLLVAVCLAGRVQAATSVAFTPPVLDFGDVVVGTTSMKTVIVTNLGPDTFAALGAWAWGTDSQGKVDQFELVPLDTCYYLAPGSSCVLTFSFTPASVGNKHGTFRMYDNVEVNGQVQVPLVGTLGLRGRGVKPPR
jgi:Abnormal spindle-like microcephaly-assoc'd, ASPM-SPD-2-Hydin